MNRILSFLTGIAMSVAGIFILLVGFVSSEGIINWQTGGIILIALICGLALIGLGIKTIKSGFPDKLLSSKKNVLSNHQQIPSYKNLKWPDNYQERVETTVGAKYDKTNHIYFLGFDFQTVAEAKDAISRIQLIQKQLRQIKTEINNKIKVIKSQRLLRAKKSAGSFVVFASLLSDINSGNEISNYKNVVFNIEKLLDASEKQKLEIKTWLLEQKNTQYSAAPTRKRISDKVQVFVWNRDGGKCVKCGSQENLEFDHIIPVSKGGSNTARNLQLLCQTCNRGKSNHIGG